jgi:hypothetical protein
VFKYCSNHTWAYLNHPIEQRPSPATFPSRPRLHETLLHVQFSCFSFSSSAARQTACHITRVPVGFASSCEGPHLGISRLRSSVCVYRWRETLRSFPSLSLLFLFVLFFLPFLSAFYPFPLFLRLRFISFRVPSNFFPFNSSLFIFTFFLHFFSTSFLSSLPRSGGSLFFFSLLHRFLSYSFLSFVL